MFFRQFHQTVQPVERQQVRSWTPSILLVVMLIGLALANLIDPDFVWFAGTLCIFFGLFGVLWGIRRDKVFTLTSLKRYDWDTTLFLAGIFVLVHQLDSVSIMTSIKDLIIVGTEK